MSNKLVIYGTLMDPRFGLKKVHQGIMAGDLYALSHYPALVNVNTDNQFYYEIAEVTPDDIKGLDIYEGVSSGLYRRELIDTPLGEAWTYIYNRELPDNAQLITDWRSVKQGD